MIKYKCAKCGATLESPSSMAGQEDKCPVCGHLCVVPQAKNRLPLILAVCGAGVAVVILAVGVAWLWPKADGPNESSQAREAGGEKVVAKAPPETKVPTGPSQDARPRPKPPPTTKPEGTPTTKPKTSPTTKPKPSPTTKPKVPPGTKPKESSQARNAGREKVVDKTKRDWKIFYYLMPEQPRQVTYTLTITSQGKIGMVANARPQNQQTSKKIVDMFGKPDKIGKDQTISFTEDRCGFPTVSNPKGEVWEYGSLKIMLREGKAAYLWMAGENTNEKVKAKSEQTDSPPKK